MIQNTDSADLIWETIVDRDQIERHLLDSNDSLFGRLQNPHAEVV